MGNGTAAFDTYWHCGGLSVIFVESRSVNKRSSGYFQRLLLFFRSGGVEKDMVGPCTTDERGNLVKVEIRLMDLN